MAYDAKHDNVIELLLERGANVEGLFDYRGRLPTDERRSFRWSRDARPT
jgi:hypothetical protein